MQRRGCEKVDGPIKLPGAGRRNGKAPDQEERYLRIAGYQPEDLVEQDRRMFRFYSNGSEAGPKDLF